MAEPETAESTEPAFDFDALKDLLVCPVSRAALVHPDPGSLVSTDPDTRLRYRVEGGIPVLLPDAGEEVPKAEWDALMAAADPPRD